LAEQAIARIFLAGAGAVYTWRWISADT